ncbi:MAG: hypothetical protein WCF36_02310 [Candidatus Nanopelagicales bacterium]
MLISAGLVGLVLTAIFAVTSALPLRELTRVDAQRLLYEEYFWCHYEWSGEPGPGSNPEYAEGDCLPGSPMGPVQVFVDPQGYVRGSWQMIAALVFGPVVVALMLPLTLLLAGILVRRGHRSRTG